MIRVSLIEHLILYSDLLLVLCMYACLCVFMCIQVNICAYVCGSQRTIPNVIPQPSCNFLERGAHRLELAK